MIQFGFSLAFASIQSYQPQPRSQTIEQADQQVKTPDVAVARSRPEKVVKEIGSDSTNPVVDKRPQSTQAEQDKSGGSVSEPKYQSAIMSPAYMMAFPQMNGDEGAAEFVQSSSVTMSGYAGFGGVGEFTLTAQSEIRSSSVFVKIGFSMVFQGSVPQPPIVPNDVLQVPPADSESTVSNARVISETLSSSERTERVSRHKAPVINELNVEDFAKFRSVEKYKQEETKLSLELKTKDGDVVSLDFSQLDSVLMSRFKGLTLDGERVKNRSLTEDFERTVNMSVVGNLSAAEQAAIDEVLATVIEVANSFFDGDMGKAVEKLQGMDFNGEQLASLSLDMSMSKTVSVTRGYQRNGEALQDLMSRDEGIGKALDFMGAEQKRLVDVAQKFFDAPSAAKLVRTLVPMLTSEPFAQLNEAGEDKASEDKVTDGEVEKGDESSSV